MNVLKTSNLGVSVALIKLLENAQVIKKEDGSFHQIKQNSNESFRCVNCKHYAHTEPCKRSGLGLYYEDEQTGKGYGFCEIENLYDLITDPVEIIKAKCGSPIELILMEVDVDENYND